jgi:uncharacterized protein
MNFNVVHNVLIVIVLWLYAIPSYAEDWSGTRWEDVGKCDFSYKEILKGTEGEENIRTQVMGEYVYVTIGLDLRDPAIFLYKRENEDKMCLVADYSGGVSPVVSSSGESIIETTEYTAPQFGGEMGIYNLEIIYKQNKQGLYFPSECASSGNNIRIPFNCYKVFKGIVSTPSFDCTDPKKLTHTEQIICNDKELSDYDLTLAINYRIMQTADIGELREKLIRDQHEWLKRRNECKDNKDCLLGAYRERTNEVCNNYPVVSGPEPYCNNPEPFASFDCSNPNILGLSERAICRNERLSGYDSTLARNYKALLAADIGELRDKLIRDQDEWLKRRNKCKDSSDCLSYVYGERINDLCNNYPVVSGPKPYCRNTVTYPSVYCYNIYNPDNRYNSYDPTNLSLAEQTICNDKGLLYSWNLALTQNYEAFQNSDIGGLQNKLIRDQLEWAKRRNECKDNKDCLLEAYMMRNYEICNIYPVVSGSRPPICDKPDRNCYDTEKFSLAEQTICKAGGLLSSWRDILADNYDAFLGSDIGGLQSKLIRDQLEWLKRLYECKDNKDCLLKALVKRSNEICNNYPVVSGPKPICRKRDETTM